MITVKISKEANYPVSSPEIKRKLKKFLSLNGIVSDCVVSVAVVGEKKMRELSRKYLKDKILHNVLSFTETELKGGFVYPPDGKIYLGEIIICFPKVLEEAKLEGKLINQKAYELVEHGAEHLLGRHHE
jgi:probable rRNA maturation factor